MIKQAEKIVRLGVYEYLTPTAIFISDQIGINKQWRKREHRRRDLRLIAGQRMHNRRRRTRTRRQRIGKRAAHQRARIVEQHQHRAFRCGGIVGRKLGVKVGAGERAGRFRPLTGGSVAYPLQELANNHLTHSIANSDCS